MEQELRFGLDLGQMANFPVFIASNSLYLSNHHGCIHLVNKVISWLIIHKNATYNSSKMYLIM